MSRTELFRLALAKSETPLCELSSFIQDKYGVRIDQGTSPFFVRPCKTRKGWLVFASPQDQNNPPRWLESRPGYALIVDRQ